jgi:uncharacterized RDD family membrane protein YckC
LLSNSAACLLGEQSRNRFPRHDNNFGESVKKIGHATPYAATDVSGANTVEPAGLLRRLAALGYDAMALVALWFVAAVPFVWLANGTPQSMGVRVVFQLYLLSVAFAFFGWFWVHGGQTLGMRAWRLRVVDNEGRAVTWAQAARRFAAAILSLLCAGIGLLWVMHDRERRAWHDRLSGTRVVVLPKRR